MFKKKQWLFAILTLVVGVSSAAPAVAGLGTPINPDLMQSTAGPRLVRVTRGDNKGAILASVAPNVIYKSTDEGATFTKLSEIPFPSRFTRQCCEDLYEVPRTVGTIPAGTLLFSASFCEDKVAAMPIFSSSDGGNTWTFLANPVTGGRCEKDPKGTYQEVKGDGLWEPYFEVAADGALVMFWSDETDPRYNQKLSQIRTYDGMTWQDKKDTVASTNPNFRPGMAVVSRTGSGKYFMTYELCEPNSDPKLNHCDVTYRVSNDGWDFGPPADLGTTIVTDSGLYFQHAPRNIWFPINGSKSGALVVVGQMLYEKGGIVSPENGKVLFVNSSPDGSGKWKSVPAPVKVPNPGTPAYEVCRNYSSTLLPVKKGTEILEMATDGYGATCNSYYASEAWSNPVAAPASLGGSILSKSGPSSGRTWTFEVGNSGAGRAEGTAITSITLEQTRGTACNATVDAHFPLVVGDIAPGASAQVPVTIDFSGCAPTAAFSVTAKETANQGAATGSINESNQFE